MSASEIAHLELLAEVDSLTAELAAWVDGAPPWPPARACEVLIRRLIARADSLRVRLEAPLVVATLGGTGTGKSTLVNALVGEDVTSTGRERPTTRRPVLICREDLGPEALGIDPGGVAVVRRDLPALRDLVLIDCPDPDTTEDEAAGGSNLARLRDLLPHCDVLLVTSTQQKYRSARVTDELAAAATGARLVFVQTHADTDEDVRADWVAHLQADYEPGDLFFVDSLAALDDAKQGVAPRGDFARLVDLLTRGLAGAAAHRIRRANLLDLIDQALAACGRKIQAGLPAVEALETALIEQRARLSGRLADQMRGELLGSRRQWENRLLGEVASRWGFSPFSLLLRAYQGVGGLFSAALLGRVRSPAQLALWGAIEGGRQWRSRRQQKQADSALERAAWSWDQAELRTAAIIVDGYASEAGLPRDEAPGEAIQEEAAAAGDAFVGEAAAEVQTLIGALAGKHTGRFTRWRYEIALLAMLGLLIYRLGKNFFYDTWLAPLLGIDVKATPMLGLEFFVQGAFWLLLWCALLLWLFTGRLRRGLRAEINRLAQHWSTAPWTAAWFRDQENQTRAIHTFEQARSRLETSTTALRKNLTAPEKKLGHRIGRQ